MSQKVRVGSEYLGGRPKDGLGSSVEGFDVLISKVARDNCHSRHELLGHRRDDGYAGPRHSSRRDAVRPQRTLRLSDLLERFPAPERSLTLGIASPHLGFLEALGGRSPTRCFLAPGI